MIRYLFCCVILTCVSAPLGAFGQSDFTFWQYPADEHGNAGHFAMHWGEWRETKKGVPYAKFRENRRTERFVELNDPDRKINVRLYADHCEWAWEDSNEFHFICPGTGDRGAEHLYLLLVIDTNAAKRGGKDEIMRPGMQKNLEVMQAVINEAVAAHKQKFKDRVIVDVLQGDDVTPENIRRHYGIGRHKATTSSSLAFYYCGHGATDPAKGHYLATSGGDILRSEVRDLMHDLKPRSIVLLSDCCSSFANFVPPARRAPAKWKSFYNLFFENQGIVDFTAASRGQFGWVSGNNGGFFTRALTNYLCEPRDRVRFDDEDDFVDWKTLFTRVRDTTADFFQQAKDRAPADAEIKNSAAQTPEAFQLGGRIGAQGNGDQLRGSWTASTIEYDDGGFNGGGLMFIFDADRFITSAPGTANSEGSVKLNAAATPKIVDLVFTDGPKKGTTLLCIYELKGDKLTYCFNRKMPKQRPTNFVATKDSGQVVVVLDRNILKP